MRLPTSSTSTLLSGSTTVVVSSCSMIAGPENADPDFVVCERGNVQSCDTVGQSATVDSETINVSLNANTYVIDAYDWRNVNSDDSDNGDTCFNVTATVQ